MTPDDEEDVKNDQEDKPTENRRLFCFGLGYSALVLARRLRDEGWAVAGTCRREEKQQQLIDEGFETFLFDISRTLDSAKEMLKGTTHIVEFLYRPIQVVMPCSTVISKIWSPSRPCNG